MSDKKLMAKFGNTAQIKSADLDRYDAIHVAGGRGATFDLYPNKDLATALEYFWAHDKVVGAICHGAIALANNRERIGGRRATAFSLDEDRELERQFGSGFTIPHYPQTTLEDVGAVYSTAGVHAPHVVVDGRLVTGQNQQSASGIWSRVIPHFDRTQPSRRSRRLNFVTLGEAEEWDQIERDQ